MIHKKVNRAATKFYSTRDILNEPVKDL